MKLPIGSGHLFVDEDDDDDRLTVYLQHLPAADLLITCSPRERGHGNGEPIPGDYEGLPFLGLQPSLVGRYVVDARTGDVLESKRAFDEGRWGGVLHTQNLGRTASRAKAENWFYGGIGFQPDLVPASGYALYRDFAHVVVPMERLPTTPTPGHLARFDLGAVEVADVFPYPDGEFPHPPVFVPKRGGKGDLDGDVVTIVHRDGDKGIQVFDAADLARGPLAEATAPGFRPALLRHGCHLDPGDARPRAPYRVRPFDDVRHALTKDGPSRLRALGRLALAAAKGRAAKALSRRGRGARSATTHPR